MPHAQTRDVSSDSTSAEQFRVEHVAWRGPRHSVTGTRRGLAVDQEFAPAELGLREISIIFSRS